MAADVAGQPLPRRRPVMPEPAARELLKAADTIRTAVNPVALAGNGVVRAGAAPALREFCRATGIPVAETFMGKGVLRPDDPLSLGTVGRGGRIGDVDQGARGLPGAVLGSADAPGTPGRRCARTDRRRAGLGRRGWPG